jgi:hypothetical protein
MVDRDAWMTKHVKGPGAIGHENEARIFQSASLGRRKATSKPQSTSKNERGSERNITHGREKVFPKKVGEQGQYGLILKLGHVSTVEVKKQSDITSTGIRQTMKKTTLFRSVAGATCLSMGD